MTVTEPIPTTSIQVRGAAALQTGEPLVLGVDGELEAGTAAEFSTALAAAAGAGTGPDVLLDLGRLYHLDLTGLDAIGAAAAEFARHGRRLVLACVRPRVREFLALSGGEALVPVFPTLEEAALHM
ncbi:STAS domain-containing protein [Actinospica sp. MGRD01-02]|uniref:STAS domain-containing protein n=1 Tax=Actinospica acidithermotolerans TaxID=2828514 RepID=A0A941EA84_9ACTN|nr:STAS domain-containing protein [Actinospica acidithermotolerans]MBR7826773.1 STAS domain-containing protein [Actinospica acidithermotolerans]